jgi:phosphomannomutase
MNHQIHEEIFKAYDIRGIYPDQLNEDIAEKIAYQLAKLVQAETHNNAPTLVVSRDMRHSSPSLHQAVIRGICATGTNVVDIGLASTPTFYFAVSYLQYDGGIQISASHNPAEWNGLKMVRAKAVPISGNTGIQKIKQGVLSEKMLPVQSMGHVEVYKDILEKLIQAELSGFDATRIKPFKVVFDAANSMGSLDATAIFSKLNCELIPINFNLDGSFPAHEADPLKSENVVELRSAVKHHQADIGFTTDGDGDRIFVVTEKGETLAPEILRGILAQEILKDNPGAEIGYDIRPGKITRDIILAAGGKPYITRVGHSLIKEEMIIHNSPFAGESSGHFFFKSEYGSFESPVRVILSILSWLSNQNKPLSQIIAPYQKYFHSGEINYNVPDKDVIFESLKSTYSDAVEFSDIDGVYFEYPDYWFNVRGSNTEPKMRLNLEAISPEILRKKVKEVEAVITSN